MFNPLFPFTKDLLDSFIKAGKRYFVRNSYPRGYDDPILSGSFIITHYDDIAKANAHFHANTLDEHRYLYDWNDPFDRDKILLASFQPAGYKIYSSLFIPDWRKKITPNMKLKIDDFMYRETNWKPGKGEKTNLNFYFQFGQLYFSLSYKHNKISGKFDEVEKCDYVP